MAYYNSQIQLASATATDLHTAGQAEELVLVRIVANSTTSAQKFTIYKQASATDYEIGYATIPAEASVMGTNPAPAVVVFTAPKIFLANTDKIRVKSENTDSFDVFCVTRDPV